MLVSSFDGTSVPAYMRRRLRAGETAGIIAFGRNATTAAGWRSLTAAVQRAASGAALVAVDQEGGAVRTVPFAEPAAGQADQGDPAEVERVALAGGRSLRSLGVNLNLAPVADVSAGPGSVMSGRAFAGGPREVAARTRAAVRGLVRGADGRDGEALPGPRSRGGEHRRRARDRRGVARHDRGPRPSALPGGGERRGPGGDALARALSGARPGANRLPVPGGHRAAAPRARVPRRDRHGQPRGRGGAAPFGRGRGGRTVARRRGGPDPDDGLRSWNDVYPRLLARARRSPAFRDRIRRSAARVLALKRALGLRSPRSR